MLMFDVKKLRYALVDKGITQREIAKRTGVSVSTVSNVFAGRHCTEQTAEKIADALGVSLSKLVKRSR